MTRLVAALLLLACATVVHADVAPGQRVRVTLLARPQAPVVGTVLAYRPESLALAAEPDSAESTFALVDVAKLETSAGVHGNAGKGAVIGALVGGIGAGLLGALFANAVKEGDADAIPIVLGVGGAIGGALIGAGIGEGSKHEKWEQVRP